MPERNEFIAYAMDFSSYLISKIKEIDKIILYGSVARGDFGEDSDIDLFIDTQKKTEKKVNKVLENYYKTNKFKEWKLKGIQNPLSIIIGDLNDNEWKNLKRAIINTGIILYGKYKSNVEKINYYTLFSFENIKPDKKRVAVFRKLFGFRMDKKRYSGLIERIKGIRTGKGTVIVPIEYVDKLKRYFQKKRVSVKLYDFWSDTKLR